jgi:hypothetical protein
VVAAVVAMSNPNKRKGTSWESSIVDTLRANGWPYAERRAMNGSKDRGDVAGLPGVVIEAKNARAIVLGAWLDEANVERDNDHADLGVVWFKRRGKVDAGAGYVLMDGRTFARLLTGAGYGGSAE